MEEFALAGAKNKFECLGRDRRKIGPEDDYLSLDSITALLTEIHKVENSAP